MFAKLALTRQRSRRFAPIAALVISSLMFAAYPAHAGEKVIFNPPGVMGDPYGDLVLGSDGVLYGTGFSGGGSVFSLAPPAKGQENWTGTLLYQFQGGNDGLYPFTGLTPDGQGGFYGVTGFGGGGPCDYGSGGCGTVFHVAPPVQGQTNWTEAVLYAFQAGHDGIGPVGRLLLDSVTGVLYGTTYNGGPANAGTVFALTPPPPGQTNWTEIVLYSFTGALDGGYPFAYLTADASGNLYGTTTAGGYSGSGTVFELSPPAQGESGWKESVLYAFGGYVYGDGGQPHAGLVFDASGNLYSTTTNGGTFYDAGTVFELSPPSAGSTNWTETILYSFTGENDGASPSNDIIMDRNGVIYSTTWAGGKSNLGTAFKLTPPGAGETAWTEKVLYSFKPGPDANGPTGGLTAGNDGKKVVLFGVAVDGGDLNDHGADYEITGSEFAP